MKVMLLKYKSYKKDVQKKLNNNIEKALHVVGGYVEGEAKVRSPVDSGNLRGSYTYTTDKKERSVTVGTNVAYAPYLELGTSKQKPQPHLKPAVEENRRNISKLVEKNLRW